MKRTVNKILSAFVWTLLIAAIIGVCVVYVHRYFLTPEQGNKRILLDNGGDIQSVDIDYQLSGMGGYVNVRDLGNEADGTVNAAGVVGSPVSITAKRRNVERADITFNYDQSKYSTEDAKKLSIAYFNEDTGRMELLDSTVNTDTGSVRTVTSHFSEYAVVDTEKWYDAWLESQLRIRDSENTKYFNIAFVIDNSGSMDGEKNELSRRCTYDFITQLYDEDTFSLISFNSSAKVQLPTQAYGQSDKEGLRSVTESIEAGGGTSINAALESGINELSLYGDNDRQRLLILLSDGQSSVDKKYFSEAAAEGIKIITIGFGNDADEELLKDIASENGGKYYKASEKTVKEIFELIREEYLGVDLSVDSDGDGLPDKVERFGMRNQYGYMLRTDPYCADTDGDGKSDGEEMGTIVVDENVTDRDRAAGLTAYIYFKMVSNPLIPNGEAVSIGEDGAYMNGDYPISFRTDLQENDLTYKFHYSDDFFKKSSAEYNNQLAVASLGIAMSAFSTKASDQYWVDDNVYIASGNKIRREDNIVKAYNTLGFVDARFYNYDVSLNDSSSKVAYSFARKTVEDGGKKFTLITVVTRGGGYGAEWADNFNVGTGAYHEGFSTASWDIYEKLADYMEDLKKSSKLCDDVKFWVTGYSRGAAVANLTAGRMLLLSHMNQNNVFAYTFATPQGWNTEKDTLNTSVKFPGVFCVLNPGDVVPQLPLSRWGFRRFGEINLITPKAKLGISEEEGKFPAVKEKFEEITNHSGKGDMIKSVTNDSFMLSNILYGIAESTDEFDKSYSKTIQEIMHLMNMKLSNDNVGSLREKFILVYGSAGAAALAKAERDTKILLLDDYIVLKAIGYMNGLELSSEIMDNIFSVVALGLPSGITDAGSAHYPEVYLSWLLCR